MIRVRYDGTLLNRFPTIRGGMIIARDLTSGPTPPALVAAFREEQAAALARIGGRPLAELPSLAAWRRAYRAFGAEPTKYRCAAEALLRRLTKKGDIPNINLLVDLGNLVSIRYGLPLAVFDQRGVNGDLTVRLADGSERFTELGSDAIKHPEPGEVIFADDTGQVSARRWCWRQSAQSAARPDTSAVIITVEGHHDGAADDVRAALDDLQSLLAQYGGGTLDAAAVLGPDRPELAG